MIGNIAFEMGGVFYNAFLPDISPPDKIGRISGYGWGLGYVGGLLAMFIAMVGFVDVDVPWFGFSKDLGENIRATNLLVAVWFAVFSLPMFLFVRERKEHISPDLEKSVGATFRQLRDTFVELRRYRQIIRFLFARLVFNDGLVTIFAFGGIYVVGTFGFTFKEVLFFGVVLNITAGIGAFAMGFLDDKLGGKRTILITLGALIVAAIIAIFAQTKAHIWLSGIILGIFSGPNQAASRSLMGRFVPGDKETEFFGFFAFSGKATAFMGPFLLGVLTSAFGTQRAGLAVVIAFFILGGFILWTVNEKRGIEEGLAATEPE